MKRKLNILTISYLIFIILLFLSGSLPGFFGELVYYIAFIIPVAFALFLTRKEIAHEDRLFSIDKEKRDFSLPLVAPTVSSVMLISAVTSLVIFAVTGKENSLDLGDSLVVAIIVHALIPAILEEILFRYLPYRLLAENSKRCAIFASAFFFALVHHDLFSIPYAFFAGAVFMMITLATGSVIPSIIIHFINNALSVGLIVYSDNTVFAPIIYVVLGVLTLVSLVFLVKNRKKYLSAFGSAFDRGEGIAITAEMIIFALMTLMLAFASLI